MDKPFFLSVYVCERAIILALIFVCHSMQITKWFRTITNHFTIGIYSCLSFSVLLSSCSSFFLFRCSHCVPHFVHWKWVFTPVLLALQNTRYPIIHNRFNWINIILLLIAYCIWFCSLFLFIFVAPFFLSVVHIFFFSRGGKSQFNHFFRLLFNNNNAFT